MMFFEMMNQPACFRQRNNEFVKKWMLISEEPKQSLVLDSKLVKQ